MKELSIEEKAKAYDEAVKKLKVLHDDWATTQNRAAKEVEEIFPILKESEDERTWIINYLSNRKLNTSIIVEKENLKKAIAWLEKQGEQKSFARYKVGDTIYYDSFGRLVSFVIANIVEDGTDNPMYEDKDGNSVFQNDIVEQKPADKVESKQESKFKTGTYVVYLNDTYVLEDDGKHYILTAVKTNTSTPVVHIPYGDEDYTMRKWTIQDAKAGDVLCCESGWTCIFKALNSNISFSSYCFMDGTGWFCGTGSESHTLDKAFIKAYNGEIHPATKEQRDLLFQKMHEAGYEWNAEKKELKKIEQKHAKQEWSEEDEKKRKRIMHCLSLDGTINNKDLADINDWLKSPRPQIDVTDEELAQAKKEAYNDALDKIEYHSGEPTFDDGWSAAIWYLKKRNGRPQNRWKPSYVQMEVLLGEINAWTKGCPKQKVLESLYNDLKKLREE